jgi:hypothetical protein
MKSQELQNQEVFELLFLDIKIKFINEAKKNNRGKYDFADQIRSKCIGLDLSNHKY